MPDQHEWAAHIALSGDEAISAWQRVIDGVERFNFLQIPTDILGHTFQKLVSPEERHKFGQHYCSIAAEWKGRVGLLWKSASDQDLTSAQNATSCWRTFLSGIAMTQVQHYYTSCSVRPPRCEYSPCRSVVVDVHNLPTLTETVCLAETTTKVRISHL